MNKEMKALLLDTYKGKEIIEYIEELEIDNEKMAENLQYVLDRWKAWRNIGLRLEKALEKASETLAKSKFKMTCGEARKKCMENHCFGYSCIHSRNFTKEEWKAWCLDENR